MEIIKKQTGRFKFRVLKPFSLGGGLRKETNEEIELEQSEADDLVYGRKVEPVDINDGDVYIALTPFSLPGAKEKFTCKSGEKIALRREDALSLLLSGAVIPVNASRWRPLAKKIKPDDPRERRRIAALQEAAVDASYNEKLKMAGLKKGGS